MYSEMLSVSWIDGTGRLAASWMSRLRPEFILACLWPENVAVGWLWAEDLALMRTVVLAAASKTAMRLLRLEDLFTAAVATTISETASAAVPPVPVTAAAGVVPVVPRPLRLGDVAETPLLECQCTASKSELFFPLLVGMAMWFNANWSCWCRLKSGRMRARWCS